MNRQESKYFFTASLMQEALLDLLDQKDFEFITVKELCSKAGVNRSTFYLHYETMIDLLQETTEMISQHFTEDVVKKIDRTQLSEIPLIEGAYLIPYLHFVQRNKKLYRVVHKRDRLFKTDKAIKSFTEKVFQPALIHFGVPEKERPYVLSFYLNGVLSVIGTWIEGDCQEDPEEIADFIERQTRLHEQDH